MTRIIISGSRSFDNYDLLSKTMNALTFKLDQVEVLSGHAEGADRLGEKWAAQHYHTYHVYRPDYDKHGKGAPLKRNEEMAQNADCCVCFWDGQSNGTAHMIAMAKKYKLKLRVIKVKGK